MADKIINVRIQQKFDTEANWAAKDPVLLQGEMAVTKTTNQFKMGDGTSKWSQLAYNQIPWTSVSGRPSTMPNPNTLTLQFNGVSQKAYNGAEALTLNITPAAIGASGLSHSHNYAGSPSAGGNAYKVNLSRVAKDANYQPGGNTGIWEEFTNGTAYNLPTNAWYHIFTGQGSDANYNTQLALGMTANNIAYRNRNSGTWQPWQTILTSGNYNTYAPTKTGSGASGTWGISISGNSGTATKLQTARAINGTNYDGTGAITTALWGTARTLTIGATGKSVNGSGNVTWSLAEIGAAATTHSHSYLPLSGGSLSGNLTFTGDNQLTWSRNTDYFKIGFKNDSDGDTDSYGYIRTGDNGNEYFRIERNSGSTITTIASFKSEGLRLLEGSFIGNLSGTASNATKATQDSAGQPINTTYIKGLSVSGRTITYTKGNGTTGTLTTQDTTYPVYFKTPDANFATKYRTQTGVASGNYISVLRNNTASVANAPQFGTGLGWGREDTHGYLYLNYGSANAYIGAGNADKLNWIKQLAFLDSNITGNSATSTRATSADKLTTARNFTIGNAKKSFNATADLSYSIAEIGAVNKTGDTMTGSLKNSFNTGTYLAGNQGNALIASTASAGTYVSMLRYPSSSGYFTLNGYQKTFILGYTAKTTVDAGTNSLTKQVTLLDESGNTSFPGTVTAPAFNGNSTSATKLQNARKIGNADFNGTANITLAQIGAAASSHTHNYAGSSSAGGAANTAVKLSTARTITIAGDFGGSFSFDGSANVSCNLYNYYSKSTLSNTNNYPYHRIAYLKDQNGAYTDRTTTLFISQDYNGGYFGIVRISLRTNNTGSVSTVEAKWLCRSGFNADDIQIGIYNVYGGTYADVFLKHRGTYTGTIIRNLGSGARGGVSRTWVLVNSNEIADTTTSDAKSSSEVYVSIAAAGTKLHSKAYTLTVNGVDSGTTSYSNSAGSATKATQDASGNTITSSYAASASLSGSNLLVKSKSGSTLSTVNLSSIGNGGTVYSNSEPSSPVVNMVWI